MRPTRRILAAACLTVTVGAVWAPTPASAQQLERLCDPGWEDCRAVLIQHIRAERTGLDVAFWFMEDHWIASEVIARHDAGVPVRILVDTRANGPNPRNADRLAEFQTAGIPMRQRVASGILHWKMMLFAGQGIVNFSGANYSSDAWVYSGSPGTNYVDEAIYFTDDTSVVNSFRTKFDDLWTNTSQYADYANISGPLMRRYSTFAKDPELNFPPLESFFNRSVAHYDAEGSKIDATIYRITDQRHTNALIAANGRGVTVRIITEPQQYRDPNRLWHSWNVDRLYMAGIAIRHRAHAGLNHQKSTLFYAQQIAVIGSSNWTSPSDASQEEHNYFTAKPTLFTWLVDQFERKWNNSGGVAETTPFVPLPPDAATAPAPASGTIDVTTTDLTLKWHAGYWAHKYDIYFGTSSNPPLLAADQHLGPSRSTTDYRQYTLPLTLDPGTRYYWKIVSKTMADQAATSETWSFTTAGSAPPPPSSPPPPDATDIVLYAGHATTRAGAWLIEADTTAAGGVRMRNPDAGAAKLTVPYASPANYFELTFDAQAGQPYRLWIRGRADANYWGNDSTFVQFSGSVDAAGTPIWRIGTTSATEVSLEECSGCGLSNWGWQDNGWGAGVLGPVVYFATTGTQRLRVQTREDGFAIDQIVLSPSTYLHTSPGANKNDTTILAEQGGSTTTTPPGDTQAPAVSITAPGNGATVSGTVAVTVDATDNVAVDRVELLLDGVLLATDTTAPYSVSWNTAAAANGSHTLSARAVDTSNNTGVSSTVTVSVSNTTSSDTTAPSVKITSPAADTTVSGTVSVAVTATDNVAVTRVELLVDGVLAGTDTTAPYTIPWDSAAVPNGSHTLRARAYDAANNVNSKTVTVTVSNTTTTTTTSAEIVLWTADVTTTAGAWQMVSDATAAGGMTLWNPDGGTAKIGTPLASPNTYFEVTFNAQAGTPYRLWMRGKADGDYYANDSVFIQFDQSVTSSGAAQWRIGTTSAAEYNLEECSGCGISQWGWQDNGWGAGVMGPLVYFSTTGPQRMRIQTREDGLRIDQIVLSPATYLNTAPGPAKNATNVLGKTQ